MRGMKKWLPFKSLKGQYAVLEENKEKQSREERPDLSAEGIEEINMVLCQLKKNDLVKVRCYQNGHIVNKELTYLKCDSIEKRVIFKELVLDFDDLLGMAQSYVSERTYEVGD